MMVNGDGRTTVLVLVDGENKREGDENDKV
jgi:hypothetical protein